MPTPLVIMYLLGVVIGIASYFVSRGPDGRLIEFYFIFATIAVVYVGLAWATRHQPIWLHIGGQLLLFGAAAALGLMPKPHLEEMAGMLYLFIPAAIVGMIVLACLVRLAARWI